MTRTLVLEPARRHRHRKRVVGVVRVHLLNVPTPVESRVVGPRLRRRKRSLVRGGITRQLVPGDGVHLHHHARVVRQSVRPGVGGSVVRRRQAVALLFLFPYFLVDFLVLVFAFWIAPRFSDFPFFCFFNF